MLLNTLTLEERERIAYAEGHTYIAALLAQAVDNENLLEIEQESRYKDDLAGEKITNGLENDIARLEDQLFTMRELVEQAVDYLKAGNVDGAGCTLAQALA